jgi:hypothetical protein
MESIRFLPDGLGPQLGRSIAENRGGDKENKLTDRYIES